MPALERLTIVGCSLLSSLSLRSHCLRRLLLRGTRGLGELDLRCPQLEEVAIEPQSPGLAAAAGLRHISLASHAVQRLAWAAFPSLREVVLQCPNLLELDLSECSQLRDSVFESMGAASGYQGPDHLVPSCPRLRVLKLVECDGLRSVALASSSLECLQMSQCRGILGVQLDCPSLTALALEECTALEAARLRSNCMTVSARWGGRAAAGRGGSGWGVLLCRFGLRGSSAAHHVCTPWPGALGCWSCQP